MQLFAYVKLITIGSTDVLFSFGNLCIDDEIRRNAMPDLRYSESAKNVKIWLFRLCMCITICKKLRIPPIDIRNPLMYNGYQKHCVWVPAPTGDGLDGDGAHTEGKQDAVGKGTEAARGPSEACARAPAGCTS
jgi:hypothetical protein